MTAPITLDQFYKTMAVPDDCVLGKRIYKKHFYDNSQLNVADKKAFVEDIDSIEWRYTLKPSTINVSRFEDDTHEYLEIAILQVLLTSGSRVGRIAATIQKSIPHPVLIVFFSEDQFCLNAAEKRINRADSNKIVVEAIHDTGWISLGEPTQWQVDFLTEFCLKKFSYHDYFTLYQDMVTRIIALNCAAITRHYSLASANGGSNMDRVQALLQVEELQQEKTGIRNKLKKEKNLGTLVQLNTQIKRIKDRIKTIKQEL